MPQNRPRIPADVERKVLIEAGHRCAVCGAELPLERAHIIPWSRSKDHSAANLLCLCANCHGRADTENWGEETLRQYKQRPWVIWARIAEATAPSTAFSPLHQLPPPPADFTGRAAELAELREAATRGGVTISGVRGMGGIGKTALALALSRELAPLYTDAQIYLDLQGVSANPVPAAQAMAHVIRAFYPDTRLPESEAEIAAIYRSALHSRRAILLMDNAAGADQIQPLIPPEGCLLLVTSRFFFHLPGFQVKDLDEMPPEDARDLLLQIAPRIGEQAERIAAVCAGVPLALRQAAGTLAERPDLSPASHASRLESGKAKLGLIEASLRLSYDLLPDELAGHWLTLSVFPAGFDSSAAAAVWELEPEPADTALGELIRRSLVGGDEGRYRLHDLARVFADSRCSEEERTGAQRRHAEHYRGVLAQAQALYLEGGLALLSGLGLVDLEWANIRAGQAWAVDHAAGDQASAELAWRYPHTAFDCLVLRLRPQEFIGWLEPALRAARQLGRRDWEGKALGNLGYAYDHLGETRRAIEIYEQNLAERSATGAKKALLSGTSASPTRASARPAVPSKSSSKTSPSPEKPVTARWNQGPWAALAPPTRSSAKPAAPSSSSSNTLPWPEKSATGRERPLLPGISGWRSKKWESLAKPLRCSRFASTTCGRSATRTPKSGRPKSRLCVLAWAPSTPPRIEIRATADAARP